MTIWFSASCSLTILPNSVGLPALPLRMTSVVGSNRLTILPSAWVSPAKTREMQVEGGVDGAGDGLRGFPSALVQHVADRHPGAGFDHQPRGRRTDATRGTGN